MKKAIYIISIGLALAGLLFIFVLATPPQPTAADLNDILKLLAAETAQHRLTDGAEQGRVIVFNVSSFKADEIADFIGWAEAEYNKPPNLFAVVAEEKEDSLHTEQAVYNVWGDLATQQHLREWTYYSFSRIDSRLQERGKLTFEVAVTFPMMDLVGEGNAYVVEKENGTWKITERYTTWVA